MGLRLRLPRENEARPSRAMHAPTFLLWSVRRFSKFPTSPISDLADEETHSSFGDDHRPDGDGGRSLDTCYHQTPP